ncbi:MAG: efflux RND transporter periplasmic adaptor subunit, partial [Ignavibacteria bacterium]|nr:efflux RND transporter periplasmic adaptor subunit [Ignavibacteria bacterium]
MRKILITAIIFLAIGLAAGWLIFKSNNGGDDNKERKILYYRNPMNPQETSPTPKKASDGMDFVPVYEEEKSGDGKKKIAYYQDPMHPWYTSDKPGVAPDCGMDLVPVYEGEENVEGIKIDPVTVQNIGVKIETVEKRKLEKTIRTVGKVEYDETKVYNINTKIMGWVEKLYVDYTGKYVQKGQPLLEIYSPELVSTQEEYLQAIKYQKKMSGSSSLDAQKGTNELVESSKRRLQYWDISEKDIVELEQRGTPKKTMTIYSPENGIVTEKMVLQGQNIMAGMELYKIADLSNVWVIADVYQYEVPWIKNGQEVELNLSYLPGKSYKGKVTYIYPFLNEESKTIKVRTEVRNTASYDFKPGMFANVTIKSPVSIDAVAVPEQSLIRTGERTIAVISLGGGYFDPREVKTGVTASGYVQILEGIQEGEKIVTSSQFLIDS